VNGLPRGARAYRCLIRLYPRQFREEYGTDLVLLLTDQLRDDPAWRAYTRSAVDLAITVPARHLEAHMKRPPSTVVPAAYATTALVCLLLLGVGGSNPAVSLALLLPVVACTAMAVASWRRGRPFVDARLADGWWRFLVAGVALLAGFIVVTSITGEVSEALWWPVMAWLVISIGLTVTGALLGLRRLSGGHRPGAAA
jgi:hypothetical protein